MTSEIAGPPDGESTVERLTREGLVTLRVAAKKAFNGTIHPIAMKRWHVRGSKAQSGTVVYLEMILVGAVWRTSHAAVTRYLTALNQ